MIYNLAHTVERSATLYPNKEAFRCGKEALTYSELHLKTNQLANYLVASGVKKGNRVGIYMNRCLETAIALYGILKSGAAYVPMDPSVPTARTHFLIQDCGIEFLITTEKHKKKLYNLFDEPTLVKQIVGLADHPKVSVISWDSIFAISQKNHQKIEILGKDLAYIMYTSGSTGAPKGIMHTHNSGLAYAKLSTELYGLQPEDRLANHAPLHFDISTFAYFGGPLIGTTTTIVSDAHTKMPASLAALIAEEKISVWYSVPLALSQLVQTGILEQYNYENLRWVLFGGEVFTMKYLKALLKCWPHAKYSNVYGPAETNQCTNYDFDIDTTIGENLPVGKTWGNTEYKILTSEDYETPKGEVGELVVRSETMMLGYWNNSQLTQNSFYKEEVANGNMTNIFYRTGDLVKEVENGDLVFLGRADRQVKIRGYRIELDEVQAVLARHSAVVEVAVCANENGKGEKELLSAVRIKTGAVTDSNELTGYCRTQLPVYAIPSKITILDDFPRTGSGKIDMSRIKNKLSAL